MTDARNMVFINRFQRQSKARRIHRAEEEGISVSQVEASVQTDPSGDFHMFDGVKVPGPNLPTRGSHKICQQAKMEKSRRAKNMVKKLRDEAAEREAKKRATITLSDTDEDMNSDDDDAEDQKGRDATRRRFDDVDGC